MSNTLLSRASYRENILFVLWFLILRFNSLAPRYVEVILQVHFQTHFMSGYLEHFLWNLSFGCHGTQSMVRQCWCLIQFWPRSMSSYAATRPQYVIATLDVTYITCRCHLSQMGTWFLEFHRKDTGSLWTSGKPRHLHYSISAHTLYGHIPLFPYSFDKEEITVLFPRWWVTSTQTGQAQNALKGFIPKMKSGSHIHISNAVNLSSKLSNTSRENHMGSIFLLFESVEEWNARRSTHTGSSMISWLICNYIVSLKTSLQTIYQPIKHVINLWDKRVQVCAGFRLPKPSQIWGNERCIYLWLCRENI